MTTAQMKQEISKKFNEVSFRKFGNAFRKHIDECFNGEYHSIKNGGNVGNGYTWSEKASYIIGDGAYFVNEEEFKNFMNEFK